jgi:hypothetical protein
LQAVMRNPFVENNAVTGSCEISDVKPTQAGMPVPQIAQT